MTIGTILFFVVIAAGVALFVSLFVYGAGPDWMWKLGRHDPFRNLLFRRDGSWRRFGKLGVLLAMAALALITFLGL